MEIVVVQLEYSVLEQTVGSWRAEIRNIFHYKVGILHTPPKPRAHPQLKKMETHKRSKTIVRERTT